MTKYDGSEWIKEAHKLEFMLIRVDWANDHHIEINLRTDLNLYDDDKLTRLVVLCHDRMLRVEVMAASPGILKLVFYKRSKREGAIWERLPELEDHIKQIRESYQ